MRHTNLLAVPAAALVLVGALAPAAIAATSGVVHRESILTELDSSGTAGVSRIFTQLTVPAGDEVTLLGQSTTALRALNGDASAEGDGVVFGPGLNRTVADNTAELPVSVEVSYALDGETVEPKDVAGRDGTLAVSYAVRNLTARPTPLTLVNGDGDTIEQTVDVAVPMVGSLSMTLPSSFRNVEAPGAVVVGNGRGGTVVSWSLLLFAPLGSELQEVTWTADATDAAVPEASLQVVPVTPASFGSMASTERAYDGAVGSTTALTEGAREIDANLRLLADGAGALLDGLTQLRDGASDLAAGLGDATDGALRVSDGLGTARAGAGELSSGLGDLSGGASAIADGLAALDAGARPLIGGLALLSTGAGDLATGVGQLAAGATKLDANAALLSTGAQDLSTGAAQLEAGVEQLSSSLQGPDGLPSAIAGIDGLQAGIGAVGTDGTLLDGLSRVGAGLVGAQQAIGTPSASGTIRNGVAKVGGGISNPACVPTNPGDPVNPCGVSQLNGSISALSGAALTDLQGLLTSLSSIDVTLLSVDDQATVAAALATITTNATRAGTIQATAAGVATVVSQLQGGLALVEGGLLAVSAGIGDPATADTLRNGVARITGGVSNPACDLTNPTSSTNPCGLLEGLTLLEDGLMEAATGVATGLGSASTPGTLLWGADQVATGSDRLSVGAGRLRTEGTAPLAAGADRALDGAQQLAAGVSAASDGSGKLGDGVAQLAAGGTALSAGASKAAAGGASLQDGLVQLDDGAGQLADGLVTAEAGSQKLADGLISAADGGQQLDDGSNRLVEEGTTVLADKVSEATVSSSMQLEQVRAVAARGVAGDGLPYPTVDGADASVVYQFELAGVSADTGPGALGRVGLGGLALLAAAGLASVAGPRRRLGPGEPSSVSAQDLVPA